jgi:pyruvate/2-oxoglutarate dehydrogenase complex dihydrolipoamide acyltransferase (E2) component
LFKDPVRAGDGRLAATFGWPASVELRAEGNMVKPGRHLAALHRIARMALMSLMAMTLAFSATCRADDAAAAGAAAQTAAAAPSPDATATAPAPDAAAGPAVPAPEAPVTATPSPRRHGPARRLTVAQSIDESVRRLTRALDLDPAQQERLRNILLDQHRQIMKLRGSGTAASGDVTGQTLAVYDRTKTRIRAMLNDEQKKKYMVDVPHDGLAPAQADLKHWMHIQEAKRRQGQSEDESK